MSPIAGRYADTVTGYGYFRDPILLDIISTCLFCLPLPPICLRAGSGRLALSRLLSGLNGQV